MKYKGAKSISNKLRGGYYSPKKITDFMVKWAVQKEGVNVLEPSCGDGQFIESLIDAYGENVAITGIELFSTEAEKALMRGNKKTQVVVSDAFDWYTKTRPDGEFDTVVGNPPFIRYQNFPEDHRSKAFHLMREEGLSPSRLTNSWLPFVVLATRALNEGGKLALVLPAELLQVSYAKELRKYLSTRYKNIYIITFKRLVFAGIQQEIVLLLGERADSVASQISLLEFDGLDSLEYNDFLFKKTQHKILDINHDNEKWTQFYLSREELELIRWVETSKRFTKLGHVAAVDVGVVTGNNDFFILDTGTASTLKLLPHCSPIVGRSNHLSGILFTESDYRLISAGGQKILLFNPGKIVRGDLTPSLLSYIEQGENLGVADGYKCKIRLPNWWHVPSSWKPDAFLLRQIHDGPKIVVNQSGASSTDTVHRVRMKPNYSARLLAAASFNSLTFAFSEIRGRSYGGGVLELEPTEAENLIIPWLDRRYEIPFDKVDQLVRDKKLLAALDLMDSIVLKASGLNDKEIQTFRNIWLRLKNRRTSRNHFLNKKNHSSEASLLPMFAWGGSPL